MWSFWWAEDVTMAGLQGHDELFTRRYFDREVIVLCVRWSLRFRLSFQDMKEMMSERSLSMAHTTVALGASLCFREPFDQQPQFIVLCVQFTQHLLQQGRIRSVMRQDLSAHRSDKRCLRVDYRTFRGRLAAIGPTPVGVAITVRATRSSQAEQQVARRSA
jgi:hypothetical protein